MENKEEKLRRDSWDNALYTFGYAYIFDRRANKYSNLINLLKVWGILTPVTVGGVAIAYGFDSKILNIVITIAIPVLIIQLTFSVLAIIFKWDEELAYSYEASNSHNALSSEFKKLAKHSPCDFAEFDRLFELLSTKYQNRSEQDAKHSIKEKEHRKGMKYALREFQRECVGCKKVPLSMESTECPICGNFENIFKKGLPKWIKKFI